MKKILGNALAVLGVTLVTIMGATSPAFAETKPADTISSWVDSVKIQENGSVSVKSTIDLDGVSNTKISLPTVAEFDSIPNVPNSSRPKASYFYNNFSINPGYKIEVVNSGTSWIDISVAKDSNTFTTEKAELSYRVENASFVVNPDRKENQAERVITMLPLISEQQGSISSYNVNVEGDNIETTCVRNMSNKDECVTSTDDSNKFFIERKTNERVSLRVATITGTVKVAKSTNSKTETGIFNAENVKIPKDGYVKKIDSWVSVVNMNRANSVTNINNTLTYATENNEKNNIVLALPVSRKIGDARYAQTYNNLKLTDESVSNWDVNAKTDNYSRTPLGYSLFTFTPKTFNSETPTQTLSFSYDVKGNISPSTPQYASVLVKPALPIVTASAVKFTSAEENPEATKVSPNVTCGNETSTNECKKFNAKTGVLSVTGKIADEFAVGFTYDETTPFAAAAPVALTGLDIDKPQPESQVDLSSTWWKNFWTVIIIALAFIIAVSLLRYFRIVSNNIITKKSGGLYQFASNKSSTFIPDSKNFSELNSLKGRKAKRENRKMGVEIASVSPNTTFSEVSFSTPRLDSGKEIEPYLYPFVSQRDIVAATETSALSVITSLAGKNAIRIVHDTRGNAGIEIPTSDMNLNGNLSEIEKVALTDLRTVFGSSRPRLDTAFLGRLTDGTRFGDQLHADVEKLGLFREEGGLFTKGNKGRTLGTAGSTTAGVLSAGLIVVGVASGGVIPLIAGGVGLVASASGLGFFGNKIGQEDKMRTVTGTGYLARMEAFKNYIMKASPDSRYSREKSDVEAKFLPWAVVFDMPEKWVETFGASTGQKNKNVIVSGSAYPAETLKGSLRNVLEEIRLDSNERNEAPKGTPLINPDRF